jgi:hypothetical protein
MIRKIHPVMCVEIACNKAAQKITRRLLDNIPVEFANQMAEM